MRSQRAVIHMVDRPRTPRPVIVVAAVVALLILPIACTRSGPSTPAVSPAVSAPASSSSIPRTSGPEVRISLFHATHFDGVFALPNGITFANYAGLVKQLRAGLPPDQPSLFLGNGDDVSGDFVIDAFNAAGLDANTYGVNELDFGLERLATLLPRAHYAVVSANVVDRRTGDVYGSAAGARRFVVRELAGVRIGLTGLLTALGPRTIPGSPHGEVLDPAEAMREILPHVRAAGAQLIVVLSHLDTRTEAQQLARAVPGIEPHPWHPHRHAPIGAGEGQLHPHFPPRSGG